MRNNKLLITLLSVLLCVTGCAEEVRVMPNIVNKGAEYCENNRGLKSLTVRSYNDSSEVNYLFVVCKNGAHFKLKAKTLGK